jgi:acetyltransferase-like isoleucine patch superfamily enzyme
MDEKEQYPMKTHGTGTPPWTFRFEGSNIVLEPGVLVFHPENISLGENVYIGHNAILKGYFRNEMSIGNGCWIGQQCFLHSAGGLYIEENVGIGPGVRILTSQHDIYQDQHKPILHRPIVYAPVMVGEGSDIGASAVILPGVKLGKNVQVGAGAVVTKSFPSNSVIVGVPARQVARKGQK